jgi:hypothetical protein
MSSSTPSFSRSQAGAVDDGIGLDSGSGRTPTVRRATLMPWQRLAATIWDIQLLGVQRAVYGAVPHFAAHLDDLAFHLDEERRERA